MPSARELLEQADALMRRNRARAVDTEIPELTDVVPAIVRVARPGDIVITLGAGSIGAVPDRLVAALGGRTRPAPPTGEAS